MGVGVVNGLLYAVSLCSVMARLHCHMFDISDIPGIVYTCVSMWLELYVAVRDKVIVLPIVCRIPHIYTEQQL